MQYSSSGTRDGVETGMVDISDDAMKGGSRGTASHKACHRQTGFSKTGSRANGSRAVWHLAAQAGAVMMLGAARRSGVLCGS